MIWLGIESRDRISGCQKMQLKHPIIDDPHGAAFLDLLVRAGATVDTANGPRQVAGTPTERAVRHVRRAEVHPAVEIDTEPVVMGTGRFTDDQLDMLHKAGAQMTEDLLDGSPLFLRAAWTGLRSVLIGAGPSSVDAVGKAVSLAATRFGLSEPASELLAATRQTQPVEHVPLALGDSR